LLQGQLPRNHVSTLNKVELLTVIASYALRRPGAVIIRRATPHNVSDIAHLKFGDIAELM
jgi:hypothetical protein